MGSKKTRYRIFEQVPAYILKPANDFTRIGLSDDQIKEKFPEAY